MAWLLEGMCPEFEGHIEKFQRKENRERRREGETGGGGHRRKKDISGIPAFCSK